MSRKSIDILLPWETRGHDKIVPAASPEPPVTSRNANLAQIAGDPRDKCLSKRQLASYLGLSVRTISRLDASGSLPPADLTVGLTRRWAPKTIEKWLRSRPVLPGRGGHRAR